MQGLRRGTHKKEGQLLLHQDQEVKEGTLRLQNIEVFGVQQGIQWKEQLRVLLHEQQVRLPVSPRQGLPGQGQVILQERSQACHRSQAIAYF